MTTSIGALSSARDSASALFDSSSGSSSEVASCALDAPSANSDTFFAPEDKPS